MCNEDDSGDCETAGQVWEGLARQACRRFPQF